MIIRSGTRTLKQLRFNRGHLEEQRKFNTVLCSSEDLLSLGFNERGWMEISPNTLSSQRRPQPVKSRPRDSQRLSETAPLTAADSQEHDRNTRKNIQPTLAESIYPSTMPSNIFRGRAFIVPGKDRRTPVGVDEGNTA